MKILLINIGFPEYLGNDLFPMGIAYIARMIQKNSNVEKIKVIDMNTEKLSNEDIINISKDFDLVGLSFTTPSSIRAAELGKSLRSLGKIVVSGGVHATFLPEQVLEFSDFVVRGEGELTFNELINELNGSRNFSAINGLSYLKNGKIINNPDRELGTADIVDRPAYEFFEVNKYKIFSITTSKGCPNKCAYCCASRFWKSIRLRNPELVMKELKYLISNGRNSFKFHDSTFTAIPEHAEKICRGIIDNKFEIKWSCETRGENLNENMVALMKEAGCIKISIGVDSGSQEILKASNRFTDFDKIEKGISNAQKAGIKVRIYLIFGLEGETEKTVNDTLSIMRYLHPDEVMLSLATAYPGTKLYKTGRFIQFDESFRKKFGGHGVNAPLYLSSTLNRKKYSKLATYIYDEIRKWKKTIQ